MSRLSKITEEAPELLEDKDFTDLVASADKLHDLKVLAESAGGEALVKHLVKRIVQNMHILSHSYKTANHAELIAVIAQMASLLEIARFITTAKSDLEYLDQQIADTLSQ
jgi:HPt (histidine-containing phosphotransfer) domain-containing protein